MKSRYIEYEPILETHSAGDRAFLRSILDAENITYFIQGEHVAPYLFNATPSRLMVRKDQARNARRLLTDCQLSFSFIVHEP